MLTIRELTGIQNVRYISASLKALSLMDHDVIATLSRMPPERLARLTADSDMASEHRNTFLKMLCHGVEPDRDVEEKVDNFSGNQFQESFQNDASVRYGAYSRSERTQSGRGGFGFRRSRFGRKRGQPKRGKKRFYKPISAN